MKTFFLVNPSLYLTYTWNIYHHQFITKYLLGDWYFPSKEKKKERWNIKKKQKQKQPNKKQNKTRNLSILIHFIFSKQEFIILLFFF